MSPLHLADDTGADDPVALEPLARALVAHRSHVLLCGNDGPRLDRASRWLTRRLRAEADFAVELCLPSTTEALLQRFNDRLQSIALSDARDTAPPPERRVVWAVPAGGELEQHDLALLVRIAQDFPAAGVRLLVVLDDARQIEALGCRSSEWLVWQADVPAGVDDAVARPGAPARPDMADLPAAAASRRGEAPALPLPQVTAAAPADPSEAASTRRPRRAAAAMAAVSLAVLACSAAVVGAWHRDSPTVATAGPPLPARPSAAAATVAAPGAGFAAARSPNQASLNAAVPSAVAGTGASTAGSMR
jgi:hypothetical protein